METITIRNFGPVIDITINISRFNIITGPMNSGKSTVAKLIAIFQKAPPTFPDFYKNLAEYNISFPILPDTFIRHEIDNFFILVKAGILESNYSGNEPLKTNPIFIPAERIFFSTISQSIFSVISSNIPLPKWLIDFGAKFEEARNSIKKIRIDFLNVTYEFDGRTDFIDLPGNKRIKLSKASSGLQSVIPVILVILFNAEKEKKGKTLFVIEEPELNLYPSSQIELTKRIIGALNQSGDHIIFTTHSHYILESVDNFTQANAKEISIQTLRC